MTDYFKIRFIDWHRDLKVYLVNLIVMIVVAILLAVMDGLSAGLMMLIVLQAFMCTYFVISYSLSNFNTLTILANNFWYILFSSGLFAFWFCNMLIAVPILALMVYFTKKAVFSLIVFAMILLFSIFVAKKIAKYCKSKITAWVF